MSWAVRLWSAGGILRLRGNAFRDLPAHPPDHPKIAGRRRPAEVGGACTLMAVHRNEGLGSNHNPQCDAYPRGARPGGDSSPAVLRRLRAGQSERSPQTAHRSKSACCPGRQLRPSSPLCEEREPTPACLVARDCALPDRRTGRQRQLDRFCPPADYPLVKHRQPGPAGLRCRRCAPGPHHRERPREFSSRARSGRGRHPQCSRPHVDGADQTYVGLPQGRASGPDLALW